MLADQLAGRHLELVAYPALVIGKIEQLISDLEVTRAGGVQAIDIRARHQLAIMEIDLDGEDVAGKRPGTVLGAVDRLATPAIAEAGTNLAVGRQAVQIHGLLVEGLAPAEPGHRNGR